MIHIRKFVQFFSNKFCFTHTLCNSQRNLSENRIYFTVRNQHILAIVCDENEIEMEAKSGH